MAKTSNILLPSLLLTLKCFGYFFLSKHHGQLDIGKSSYFNFGLVGWGCKNLVNLNIILTFRYLDIKSILLRWFFYSKNCIFRRLVGQNIWEQGQWYTGGGPRSRCNNQSGKLAISIISTQWVYLHPRWAPVDVCVWLVAGDWAPGVGGHRADLDITLAQVPATGPRATPAPSPQFSTLSCHTKYASEPVLSWWINQHTAQPIRRNPPNQLQILLSFLLRGFLINLSHLRSLHAPVTKLTIR